MEEDSSDPQMTAQQLTRRQREFAVEVFRFQEMGFVGMLSNNLYRKEVGERLVALGVCESWQMAVADGDGWIVEPERFRNGYVLTDFGREVVGVLREDQR